MRKVYYITALMAAFGLLASCDEAVPTAPAPCASATDGEWEFLGLQDDTLAYVSTVATDPVDPTRILAGTVWSFVGGLPGRLFLSEDDGQSWVQVLVSSRSLVNVVFDPLNASSVYAATTNAVYKSTDGGRTWVFTSSDICTDAESGIDQLQYSLDGSLYVGVIEINSACAATLYRSTDGAETWEDLCDGSNCMHNGPTALGLDPTDPLRLLVGLNGSAQVRLSEDGGKSWTTTGYNAEGLPQGIVVDGLDAQKLFVSHWDGGASLSLDGGGNWQTFDEGLPTGTNGGSLLQDHVSGRLFLVGGIATVGSLWWRNPEGPSWIEQPIAGEQLFGGLHLAEDRFLYVGSYGLWRHDVKTITSNEPGACAP